MRSRIGLLSVLGAHNGPWLVAHKGESAIRVAGLGPSDAIAIEHGDGRRVTFEANGTYETPFSHMFRFIKIPGPTPLSTTVEVIAP